MKIPDSIRIMGRDYVTKYESKLLCGSDLAYGIVDINDGVIMINPDLGDDAKHKITYLHEVLHVLIANSGIELDDEEELVTRLAPALYQVIADNPKVFAE